MGFTPKKKDDETKVFTPLTDPAFRSASLSPMTIEERRKWEVMFARFHQPHKDITSQVQTLALPPGGEAGDALTTDGKNHYYWAHGGCYWLKAGANLYFATGNIAVGDVPNNANTIYAKGNILVQATDAQPYIKISNASDTERDPVYKLAVGATPVVKWTYGARDSDFDNLLWCNEDGLSDASTAGGGWTDHLFITDVGNSRVKDHSAANLTYVGEKAISGAKYICADNLYYYVTLYGTHQVSKYLISDNSLIWTIGTTAGSGDDQFNSPTGICTDYTYLYICDLVNCRLKKHLCSTGAYVAKVGSYGTGLGQFLSPTAICTDGTWLYITEGAPGTAPLLKKHLCSDLTGVSQITADGHIDIANLQGICTDRSSLFLANTNNGDISAIFKYTRNLTFVSEYGAVGSGDTQFNQPIGITTDETYLYIVDSANSRVKKHNCSDYAYVAKVGTFGSGDSQFSAPIGICINLVGQGPEERTGRLLRLHQDGSHFDVFTKLDAYKELWFHEDSVARAEYISIKAPATVVSYELTLPGADAVGALYSDGAGALSWQTLVPLNAKFIVQEANATLTAEQSLGALATGILKNTTTAGVGVLSIAVGADLPAHEHDSAYISIIGSPAANHFPYQTAGGELIDSTYNAASFEPALGNPGTTGYVLSSTDAGVRSWVAQGTGAPASAKYIVQEASGDLSAEQSLGGLSTGIVLNTVTGSVGVLSIITDNSSNWNTAYGWGDHGAEGYLTSVTAHDILSATHGDTTAAAVSRGAMIAGIGATPKWTAVAAGTEGYVWTMGADEPGWAAAPAGGSLTLDDLTDVDAASPDDHDIIQYHTGVGWVHGALPAAGSGAPADAQYVCLAVDGDLSAERVLTGTANQITITDNGANGTVVLSLPQNIATNSAVSFGSVSVDATIKLIYKETGNVSIGAGFPALTTGDNNVSVGPWAEQSITTGNSNVGIGTDTQSHLTEGSNNLAIGTEAQHTLTTGSSNVAIGKTAQYSITTGGGNVALGTDAQWAITTGQYNVAIGNVAEQNITDAWYCIGIGHEALNANQSGTGNTAIGEQSLKSATGQYNVAIGAFSGYSRSSGNTSVFIGPYSGYYETATDALFIDNRQRASEADGRAKALVYGIFDDAVANQRFIINGRLGINDTAPAEMLDVNGNINVTGVYKINDVALAAADVGAAPADAKYIVGLANATLSAEKVKPQLYNNYDIDDTPAAPNALDDEFDDSSLDVKWTIANNPAGANALSETAFPGYVWVGLTEAGTTTELYQTAPAGNAAATYIAKVSLAAQGLAGEVGEWATVEVYLSDSVNSQEVGSTIQINDGLGVNFAMRAQGFNNAGAMTTAQLQIIGASGFVYVKLEKSTANAYTSANTYNAYFSLNGIVWWQVGTETKTFTGACDRVGLRFYHPKSQAGIPTATAIADFFRRTV